MASSPAPPASRKGCSRPSASWSCCTATCTTATCSTSGHPDGGAIDPKHVTGDRAFDFANMPVQPGRRRHPTGPGAPSDPGDRLGHRNRDRPAPRVDRGLVRPVRRRGRRGGRGAEHTLFIGGRPNVCSAGPPQRSPALLALRRLLSRPEPGGVGCGAGALILVVRYAVVPVQLVLFWLAERPVRVDAWRILDEVPPYSTCTRSWSHSAVSSGRTIPNGRTARCAPSSNSGRPLRGSTNTCPTVPIFSSSGPSTGALIRAP